MNREKATSRRTDTVRETDWWKLGQC